MASSGRETEYGVLDVSTPVSTRDGGNGSDSDAGSDTGLVPPASPILDRAHASARHTGQQRGSSSSAGARPAAASTRGGGNEKGMAAGDDDDGFQPMSVELRAPSIQASPPQFTVRVTAVLSLLLWVMSMMLE